MDIVSRITSYAKAVPVGLKAAGQELAKTAGAAGDGHPAKGQAVGLQAEAAKSRR